MDKYIPYKVKAAGDTTIVSIFGNIGSDPWDEESVGAKSVVDQLAGVKHGRVEFRINSYGGSVSDGLAIHNASLALQDRGIDVATYVDGVAYSIANLIAMSASKGKRFVAKSSLSMVHAPWGMTVGNAADHRDQANTLDRYSSAMSGAYIRHGIDESVVSKWLSGEKDFYFTAQEAKQNNLADSISNEQSEALASAMSFSISRLPNSAAVKPETHKMSDEKNAKAEVAPKPEPLVTVDVASIKNAAAKSALKKESARQAEISAAFAFQHIASVPGIDEIKAKALADQDCTVNDANIKILAHMGKQSGMPVSDGIAPKAGEDEKDKLAKGAQAALLVKAGFMKRDDKAMIGNEFAGYSMLEIARASLHRNGHDTGGGKMDMIGRALAMSHGQVQGAGHHSSSDFGNILMDVANKAMLRGWEESAESFAEWTNRGTLPDFKPGHRVDLNLFPSLPEVPEGAEYTYGTIGDRGESIILMTYGKLFSITRQAVINDDLSAFVRIPQRMGRAASRTIGDLVYAVLTSNPLMSDGVAIFDAGHSNLMTGSDLDTAGVSAMRTAMALQTDSDDHATGGLNIPLRRLIVPVALFDQASTTANSEFVVGSAAEPSRIPNSVRGAFEITKDARLDTADSAAWYGVSSSDYDTIEVAYLDGNDTPYMEQQGGWNIDGSEFKVRIDCGVKALDFRAMAKNPGA